MRMIFLIFLLMATAAHAEPAIISDADRPDWLAVGRVNQGGFKSKAACSGALISPTQVLTAAHCVANPKTGKVVLPYKVKFVAGWHKGDFAGVGQAKSIRVHPNYTAKKHGSYSKIEVDLALITLAEPMGGVTPLPVSNEPFKEAPVKMFGYRFDRPHILTDYQGCSAYNFRSKMLSIDCDVVQGTSGAPVLAMRNGVWEIVGVVSSKLNNRGRDKALAALVTSIASAMDSELPASNP